MKPINATKEVNQLLEQYVRTILSRALPKLDLNSYVNEFDEAGYPQIAPSSCEEIDIDCRRGLLHFEGLLVRLSWDCVFSFRNEFQCCASIIIEPNAKLHEYSCPQGLADSAKISFSHWISSLNDDQLLSCIKNIHEMGFDGLVADAARREDPELQEICANLFGAHHVPGYQATQ